MKHKRNILFPVETINRELDLRLFLAAMCVEKDNRIFIGQHNVIDRLVRRMIGGIYLGKHIFKELFPRVNVEYYLNLKKRHFKYIHLDEEGAIYTGGEDNWHKELRERLNPNYLTADDYICTWGKYQAEFYKAKQPACEANIKVTGHPRFDLYKPFYSDFFSEETNRLREKYGEFILINSNLSFANNGLGIADTFSPRLNYNPADNEKRTVFLDYWAHVTQVLVNFIRLINRLSIEFPEFKIIVRHHPAEDRSLYDIIFKDFKNVLPLHEGSVTPWLLACRVLIHDGSTTGVEAYLGNKPVITFKSIEHKAHDLFLPDSASVKCYGEDQVVEQVKSVINQKNHNNETDLLNPLAFDLMANFKEDCFKNLVDVIRTAEEAARQDNLPSSWDEKRFQSEEFKHKIINTGKNAVRPLFRSKYKDYIFYNSHFYGFEQKVIDQKMKRVGSILKKDFNYKLYSDSLLIVEAK